MTAGGPDGHDQRERIHEIAANWERDKKVDLVFEGGGVLGIGLVGAYSVLEERGYHPQNLAGTSAGAIVATMIAAGYRAAEVRDIIAELNFNNITDPNWEERLPVIGRTWGGQGLAILGELGLYRGQFILDLLREKLAAKSIATFRDLRRDDQPGTDLRYRYKVQVMVSDVTAGRLLRLPMDADQAFGIDPDELPVAEAVRMSMSIPFFFNPMRRKNPKTGIDHVIVDGGLLSNFPVWFFDVQGLPEWPTFGLKFVEAEPHSDIAADLPIPLRGRAGGLVDYIWLLAETALLAHDRLYLETDDFVRTVTIPTLGISGTNFALSDAQKDGLFAAGRQAAADFLDRQWDYAQYLATFRTGSPPHRRDIIKAAIR